MLRFCAFGSILWHILELYVTFWLFFCTIWVFWAFFPVLSWIRFVVIYALFRVKLFWLKPCLCKKKRSFCISVCASCLSGAKEHSFKQNVDRKMNNNKCLKWQIKLCPLEQAKTFNVFVQIQCIKTKRKKTFRQYFLYLLSGAAAEAEQLTNNSSCLNIFMY